MDAFSLLLALAGGVVLGAVVSALAVRAASAAGLRAATDAVAVARTERDRAADEAREQSRLREEALRDADRKETALAEREVRLAAIVAEKERRVEELRATVEDARTKLVEAFQATGVAVLEQNAATFIAQAKEQLSQQQQLSQQDLAARQQAIDAALQPLREQLVKQEHLVTQLAEKREGDAKALAAQVQQLVELQQQARDAARLLSSALRDTRQRGRWGEVALRNVAELAGLQDGIDFVEQATVEGEDGRLRPDMTVRLPGGRLIAIDSKVPMDAYFAALEPERGDAERTQLRSQHAQAVRAHVRTLGSREYARALEGDVEFTVLFMPVESAFTAAFETDPALHPDALAKRVLVTTPSTLLALLRTVALHWSQARLAENAERIGAQARTLVERVETFVGHFARVGEHLDRSVKSYNDAVGSYDRRLVPSVRTIAELAGTAAPASPDPVDREVRTVTPSAALPEPPEPDRPGHPAAAGS